MAVPKKEPKQQESALHWLLKEKAREVARGISINDLKNDDGVKEILRILDKHPCHLLKFTQQKSSTTLGVKPVNIDNRCVPGNAHNEKEYSSFDDSEDDSDKEEDNTSNNEIKEEVYEEDDRNDEDSSNEIENQNQILKT